MDKYTRDFLSGEFAEARYRLDRHGTSLERHDERDGTLDGRIDSLEAEMDQGFAKLNSSIAVVRYDVMIPLKAPPEL